MFVKSSFRSSSFIVSALSISMLVASGCEQELAIPGVEAQARAGTGPVQVMESRPWIDPVTGEENNWNLCAEQTQYSALRVELIHAKILNGDVCMRIDGGTGKDSLDVQLTLELSSVAGDIYDVGLSLRERDAEFRETNEGRRLTAAQPTTGMGMLNGDAYDKDSDLFLGLENSPKNTCGDLSQSQGEVVWTVQTKIKCDDPIPFFGGTHTMIFPSWRSEPQEICTPSFRSSFEGAKCNNGQLLKLSPFLELCHFLPCDDPKACNPGCQAPTCGNGVVEGPTEECDDGNSDERDGCTSDCKFAPLCGNGIKEGQEQCDDGNKDENDHCSNACTRLAVCGDGVVEGKEACDDGNRKDTDACSNACQQLPVCGNGIVEAAEQCDDGNRNDTDACNNACELAPVCGNGVLEGVEECDDGNSVDSDACSNTCQKGAVCGNGVVELGEQCDDGNRIDVDTCNNACEIPPACGNGVREGFEACDDGNSNDSDACSNSCQRLSVCGNGVVESGETCDDGNRIDSDACNNSCRPGAVCGNGIVEAPEACDDGNDIDTDTCNNLCQIGSGTCASSVSPPEND